MHNQGVEENEGKFRQKGEEEDAGRSVPNHPAGSTIYPSWSSLFRNRDRPGSKRESVPGHNDPGKSPLRVKAAHGNLRLRADSGRTTGQGVMAPPSVA